MVLGVTSVVGHVLVHQPPKTLDRVQMRAVGRNEMEPDPPARQGQPVLNRPGVMVAGIVQKHWMIRIAGYSVSIAVRRAIVLRALTVSTSIMRVLPVSRSRAP